MKVQGPSRLKNRPATNSKKSNVDGSFHTFLEAEIAGIQKKDTPVSGNEREHPDQNQAQLLDKAARLLDQTLEQLAAGEKPTEQLISSIQRLRTQLHQQTGTPDEILHQADTMLAVEAERIHTLNR